MLPIEISRLMRKARKLANIKNIEEGLLFNKFDNVVNLMLSEEGFTVFNLPKLKDCFPIFPEKFFLALHDAYMER
jgi:hypothetical protein